MGAGDEQATLHLAVGASLKKTCARLETTDAVGTGFLVGPSLVMTCAHVVKDVGTEARCTFATSPPTLRTARVLLRDEAADFALLQLGEPLDVPPVPLAAGSSSPYWTCYAFPALAEGAGTFLDGVVDDWQALDRTNRLSIALFSSRFDPASPMGGASGAPILSGERIVGVLYLVLGAKSERKVPHLGLCYARPIAALPEAFLKYVSVAPHIASASPGTTLHPAADEADTRQARADVYLELVAATDAAAVRKLLGEAPASAALRAAAAAKLARLGMADDAEVLLASVPESAARDRIIAQLRRRAIARRLGKARWLIRPALMVLALMALTEIVYRAVGIPDGALRAWRQLLLAWSLVVSVVYSLKYMLTAHRKPRSS